MALRTIVQDGDLVLKKTARPVTQFNPRLEQLIEDMKETLLESEGLGLAGPQIGVLRRLFVALEITEEETNEVEESKVETAPPRIMVFVNPEITEKEGESMAYEGCLSFPGVTAAIKRPYRVVVKALDQYGTPFEWEAKGLAARCMCHEIDHLNGVTIPDIAEYFYDPNHPHELDEIEEDNPAEDQG